MSSVRIAALALLCCSAAAYGADKPTYLRGPVLRGVGSVDEVTITSEVLAAAALLLTGTPAWSLWPSVESPPCAAGCWIVEANCVGQDLQRCDVIVSEQPSGRQEARQLTLRGLAPATDVAQAIVLQAAYLLEAWRQPLQPLPAVHREPAAPAPAVDRAGDAWDASIGPLMLMSSGVSAWGLETSFVLGLSPHAFVRVSAGYTGLFPNASGTQLDYFHAIPFTASFGVRGTWARVTATASLGLVVIPVFASSGHVADSDLAIDGCVELALRYPVTNMLWIGMMARPFYGRSDVTLGEAGTEPFVLPKGGLLGTLQVGAQL